MGDEFVGRIEVSDSGFVFDPKTGSTFSLNHTALKIVRLLREGRGRDEIIGEIVKDYGIEPGDAGRDVDDFIGSLRDFAKA